MREKMCSSNGRERLNSFTEKKGRRNDRVALFLNVVWRLFGRIVKMSVKEYGR